MRHNPALIRLFRACKLAPAFSALWFAFGCFAAEAPAPLWTPYDESAELAEQAGHGNPRMRFQLINSRVLDKNTLWRPFEEELAAFPAARYQALLPLILEQDIASLQRSVIEQKFNYEELVLFYLYRIRAIESDNARSLNAILAVNPEALADARRRDQQRLAGEVSIDDDSLFGMPVLLKDNIGADGMATTAGALALRNNRTGNAFITARLIESGAVVLGKANLSEWAYFFCDDCPLGYSAIGGQTLNPYGRRRIESGGSSSGSAVAVAANLAVAAVGTETSGSILSPASANAVVGLKPSTGMLSRTGIIPLAGSLDSPGPVARNVADAVRLFNAMSGFDQRDRAMPLLSADASLQLRQVPLGEFRLGELESLAQNGQYRAATTALADAGARMTNVAMPTFSASGFDRLLAAEMDRDLSNYLRQMAADEVAARSVDDILLFNSEAPSLRAPYGQALFDLMVDLQIGAEDEALLRNRLRDSARELLESVFVEGQLDILLSINNLHAAVAALANYPAMTIPIGLTEDGRPTGLTLIAPSFAEQTLVDAALQVERVLAPRVPPRDYQR
ncbi:MAG: amidase family protein [Pseudohongiellaceae bacterium]